MGKNAKVTRFGAHVVAKRAKKGGENPNEGRRKLRAIMKAAKKGQEPSKDIFITK